MAKVLVVDDSGFQRKWLVKSLHKMGHDTIEAGDGREGLLQIENEKPDCIVTDLVMPNMNGLELLAHMKASGNSIPAIVVTADIQKNTKTQCQNLGAKAFLNKPFKNVDLEIAITECLQNQ